MGVGVSGFGYGCPSSFLEPLSSELPLKLGRDLESLSLSVDLASNLLMLTLIPLGLRYSSFFCFVSNICSYHLLVDEKRRLLLGCLRVGAH